MTERDWKENKEVEKWLTFTGYDFKTPNFFNELGSSRTKDIKITKSVHDCIYAYFQVKPIFNTEFKSSNTD